MIRCDVMQTIATPRRRYSAVMSEAELEEDDVLAKVAEMQEQHLIPLKEDLAEWLNMILEVDDITADNFMKKLDNGVIVCKLARLIQLRAEEYRRRGLTNQLVPTMKFKCWENAKQESFYARDNTENFLKWCRKFGVHEAVIFESDGLVLHSQARTVVLCLLELGRIAAKFGIEPPGLVKLEKEIDEQERAGQDASDSGSASSASSPVHGHTRTDSSMSVGSSNNPTTTLPSNGSPTAETNGTTTKRHKPSELDKKVMQIANNCGKDNNEVKRIAEGRYCIAGRNVFVRLLKGRHVMVRVGGGWDTLEHFLSRHEPCQVIMVNRKSSLSDEHIPLGNLPASNSSSPDSFLHIKARYRSPVNNLTPLSKYKQIL